MSDAMQPLPVSRSEPDRAVPECPYVGLVPFDESDAPYFFGRQRECDVIVANLSTARLTLLYAASGVGKSSALRAGVLPRFQQIATESYDDLNDPDAAVAYVRDWSQAPLDTIARAVLDAVDRVPGARAIDVPGPPRLSAPWLRDVIQRSDVAAVYLILDQFEEYFRYHPDDVGEDGLVAELGRILCTRDLPVNALLSIREDALAGLDRFKGRVPRLYNNYLRLAHLGRAAAREAIEGPLDHYNQVVPPGSSMAVEPELTDTLLGQVRAGRLVLMPEGVAADGAVDHREDIEAPYLQLVLTQLWEAERASGSSVLRRGTLDKLGGAQKIVENHLHTVMDGFSPEQREIAAKVLRYLVTESGSKNAQTAETLADWSDVPADSVRALLRALSAGRQNILRPVRPPAGVAEPPRYEIFHDVLGPAVLDWCREYLAQLAQRKLVDEREEARTEAQVTHRQLRQTRLLGTCLVVVLLIAGTLGWISYLNFGEAAQQRLLSEAAAALSENPVHSLRKAVEAYQISHDEEAVEAVLTAASVPRSRVVAGAPGEPRVVGMVVTPAQEHAVTYDAQGGIRVISNDGRIEEAKASRLVGSVVAAAVSPSASHVALATDQGSVTIIDVGARAQAVDFTTDGSPVSAVSWLDSSPDDLVLVVTSKGFAATYSAETGRQVAHFQEDQEGTVNEALPTADAQVVTVVTSDQDSRLRVWDARTAEKIAESPPLSGQIRYLQRYRQEVVGATGDGNIIRWDWQTGSRSLPRAYPFYFSNSISQMAVNEDNGTVAIALDKEVKTYRLDDGFPLRFLPRQPDRVYSVALDPSGQWIATAGADGRVRVWSARYLGTPTRATYDLIAHRGEVRGVSYLDGGKSLISLGLDGTVRLWEIPQIQRFDLHDNWVVDLDTSADGRWLATAGFDGDVHIVDLASASNAPVATIHVDARVKDVQFDPADPHRIVTLVRSTKPPQGWRWDSDGRVEQVTTFDSPSLGPSDSLVSLDISKDGEVAVGGVDGNVYLWDTHGKLIDNRVLTGSGQGAFGIAFDASGRMLAVTGPDGVLLKELGTKEAPKLLPLPGATTVAFDARGERIVGGAKGGVLRIWTRDGRHLHDNELVAHGSTAGRPSFSDDGRLVAMGTGEGLIEVWDVVSGRTVMLTRPHGDSVNDVLFLPGSPARLVSASDDSTVAVFGCAACSDPEAVVRDAERWVEDSS